MIEFRGRGVLLDIEGTTSSVSFVYDVMFPFARRELAPYLAANWSAPATRAACERIAQDAGAASLDEWLAASRDSRQPQQQQVIEEVVRLMDADAKTTGLKELQGLIWRSGFESGELEAHVYEDVPRALEAWRAAGLERCIYSSGSVAAQHLFFGHTIYGNLLPLLQGHFDTTIGPKKNPSSYTAIAAERQCLAGDLLFVSDLVPELQAAATAGFQVALCCRPANASPPANHGLPQITTFDQLSCFLRK